MGKPLFSRGQAFSLRRRSNWRGSLRTRSRPLPRPGRPGNTGSTARLNHWAYPAIVYPPDHWGCKSALVQWRTVTAGVAPERVRFLEERFAPDTGLGAIRDCRPDLVLLDLARSSQQLDQDGRRSSLRRALPRGMRMTSGDAATGAGVLNGPPEAPAS